MLVTSWVALGAGILVERLDRVEHVACDRSFGPPKTREANMRMVVLWLLGVPVVGVIGLKIFGFI
jgi:hypothetical protein